MGFCITWLIERRYRTSELDPLHHYLLISMNTFSMRSVFFAQIRC